MRPRASFPSIDKLRPQKANKLCVSLGLGQFLDRSAVEEQDRKLEPLFGFSPTAGSAAHACCERALCSILHVGGSQGLRVPVCGATSSGSQRGFPPVHFVVEPSIVQQ